MHEFDKSQIAHLRVDYSLETFDIEDVEDNPMIQFEKWMHEAIKAKVNEPNAMTLATVKPNGTPAARIVLLKGLQDNGFSFFSNYESHKGKEIAANSNVALVFCWLELQRQVRIEGTVVKLTPEESDSYFASRPRKSQIGAFASPQSSEIINRQFLEQNFEQIEHAFIDKEITRPEHWGGYLVYPNLIEFWQGRQSRLHDRIVFHQNGTEWTKKILAP
jgi:pyridoxamine 5'-phosphate oxidase